MSSLKEALKFQKLYTLIFYEHQPLDGKQSFKEKV